MVQALIFDFDGLILETELSAYQAWQEIYQEYKCELPLDKWVLCIGGSGEQFDQYSYLESLLQRPVPRAEIRAKAYKRHAELLAGQAALPGVEACIKDAKRLGLKVGLASNSSRDWVSGHLSRLGLHVHFDAIKTGDQVPRQKPHPDLYLAALAALDVSAEQAIAFEDSPNGVRAAQAAGIFCIAIPNELTGQLPLDHADMRLVSLADVSLERLLIDVEAQRKAVKL